MEDSVPIVYTASSGASARPVYKSEGLRAPVNFRSRVIAAFRSERNIEYMRGLLRNLRLCDLSQKMYEYSNGAGQAYDILNHDPLARRGNSRQASDMWSELRRLNREFYERMTVETVSMKDGDNEPYHMRAFIADSLRPPGLESLNDPDRPMFGSGVGTSAPNSLLSCQNGVDPEPQYAEEDWAWDRGNPNRTAEQAMAEYWGSDMSASDGDSRAPCGPSHAWQALRGEWWYTSDSGPRRQRYEEIPGWQKAGARNFDRDIGEGLSMAARETGNQVRGWNMERLRNSRGQENHRYGPRSSGAS